MNRPLTKIERLLAAAARERALATQVAVTGNAMECIRRAQELERQAQMLQDQEDKEADERWKWLT
jgi:hypothetical protein